MEGLVKGDIVLVPFPFSDLSNLKKRPALVAATLEGDDVVLCQITSRQIMDSYAVSLTQIDIKHGNLPIESTIRPNKLFTAHKSLVIYRIGAVKDLIVRKTEEGIIKIITNS